jgi:hypothetical protein
MLGLGPRSTSISEEDVHELSTLWGDDPVHPTAAAYKKIAAAIIADLNDGDARFTNPPRSVVATPAKKPRVDLSLEWAKWVRGALPPSQGVTASLVFPETPGTQGTLGPMGKALRRQNAACTSTGVGEASKLDPQSGESYGSCAAISLQSRLPLYSLYKLYMLTKNSINN